MQPLRHQEESAEADALIVQSLFDPPVCVFSVSRSNLYVLDDLSRLPIHCLVLHCCVALHSCLDHLSRCPTIHRCLVLHCWILPLSRLPLHCCCCLVLPC